MKWMFDATDVYSALWPLHFISRIFGLAPYSLKPDFQSVKCGNFLTYFFWMWSIFCLIFLALSEYIHTNRSIDAGVTLKEKVKDTLRTAFLYSYSIVTLFLSLTANRGKLPQILLKFSEIDQLFSSKLYRIQIYKNTRLFLTVQFAMMITVII
jgi:hypothetical protein